jgi:predicted transcriptional regulator
MNAGVFSVAPEESVDNAYREIIDKHYSGVPIVGPSAQVVGMVTVTDILRVPAEKRGSTPAEGVMTKSVVVVGSDESLLDAPNKIVSNNVGQLSVVERSSGSLVGIIKVTDAIRAYDNVVKGTSNTVTTESPGTRA